jgi:tetratricopeptide (TPR) repeat protein
MKAALRHLAVAISVWTLMAIGRANGLAQQNGPAPPPSSNKRDAAIPGLPTDVDASPAPSTPQGAPPSGASANKPAAARPAGPQSPAVALIPQPGRKTPQPKSPEEAAAYQGFLTEQSPDARIRKVEDFLLQYPDSEFRESAYQSAMLAYRQKNDLERMLTYGDLTLGQNPDNLTALLMLSTALSELTDRNDSDRDDKLQEGDGYAAHALESIGKMIKPPGFPDERWAAIRHESESTAHAARGLIALIREDFPKAELELKEAATLAKPADAVLLYRLGLSYSFQKKYQEALETFDQAQAMGGIKMPDGPGKTRDLVLEAKQFAAKALAAEAPPLPAAVSQGTGTAAPTPAGAPAAGTTP